MNYDNAVSLVLENLRIRRSLGEPVGSVSRDVMAGLFGPVVEAPARIEETPPPAAPSRAPEPVAVTAPAPAVPVTVPLGKSRRERLEALRPGVLACTKCPQLVRSRTQVVFGVGNPEAELLFIGEAPGADEDAQGEPFVGRAGQLLTKIIETMGFKRGDVYIANVLKCRPDMPEGSSGNRPPTPAEMETCLPYLMQQVEIIQPKVMVALGSTAMAGLFPGFEKITKNRGKWHDFRGTPVMPTYHPSYLLRNQSNATKREVWEDMLQVKERLGHVISERDRGYFLPKPT